MKIAITTIATVARKLSRLTLLTAPDYGGEREKLSSNEDIVWQPNQKKN
jgi:hypothetical protein